jgi:hypothetical protein
MVRRTDPPIRQAVKNLTRPCDGLTAQAVTIMNMFACELTKEENMMRKAPFLPQ